MAKRSGKSRSKEARGKKVKTKAKVVIEEMRFTQAAGKPPAPKGTVRLINYGSRWGRVGRPRKCYNPGGLAV